MCRLLVIVVALVLGACALLLPCRVHADIESSAIQGTLRAVDLRCEGRHDPIGIGEPQPLLTWTLESDRRDERQTAYRVLVASSPQLLEQDRPDLWDSGRVESAQTCHVAYAGTALGSRRICFWKVMAWDRDGAPGAWSHAARWEMGLLEPTDWSAAWIDASPSSRGVEILAATYATVDDAVRVDVTTAITAMLEAGQPIVANNTAMGGDPLYGTAKRLTIEYRSAGELHTLTVPENAKASLPAGPIPYLRRGFEVERPLRIARLYATSLGVYEAWLNGTRVGDQHLAPGWTDYRRRVTYQVFDVTDQIRQGANTLGAIVGPGWFCGRAGLFHARAYYGTAPALLAQLELTYADGTVERITSDASWQRADGPILASDMMDGESYDARHELAGWCEPGSTGTGWAPASLRPETRRLDAMVDEPVRVLRELPAQTVSQPVPGRWVFDLGQNMVGVARLRVRAEAGTVLTVRHAEMLQPDGTLYTENLRGAAATDTYVCRGGPAPEVWQPGFTFHGFRYVEIAGLASTPELDAVTGIVLGSDLEPAGEFACSNPLLNQLQSNIVWGLRGNYLSIPTDCPQRDERMGWMADAQVFAPSAASNANVAPFMAKWMTDVRDAQRADGAHADVAPVMGGLNFGTPAWGDAGTFVPWTMWERYADRRELERNIASMMAWVDWCEQHSTGLIRDRDRGNDYGDWLSIEADTPKDLIGTAYFARSAWIVSRSLLALGRESDAAKYQDLFERIRAAFIARYVAADGSIAGQTQTGYLLALRFNLLPDSLRDAAAQRLVADLERRGDRLSTGFLGVGQLLPVLADAGRDDMAYRVLLQDKFPSWLFSVKQGATTIWERWDGWTPEHGPQDPGMNSFNHYSLGSCGEWLFSGIAGIEPDQEYPGFERFTIRPRIGGGLSWASATYRSVRGLIASRWDVSGRTLRLRVRVPANTVATIHVPAAQGSRVLESGGAIQQAAGVRLIRTEANAMVLEVGSGEYQFDSELP